MPFYNNTILLPTVWDKRVVTSDNERRLLKYTIARQSLLNASSPIKPYISEPRSSLSLQQKEYHHDSPTIAQADLPQTRTGSPVPFRFYKTLVDDDFLTKYAQQYEKQNWRYRLDLTLNSQWDIPSVHWMLKSFLRQVSHHSADRKPAFHYVIEFDGKPVHIHAHMLLNTDVPANSLSRLWHQYGHVGILELSQAKDRFKAVRYALSRELEYLNIDDEWGTSYSTELMLEKAKRNRKDYSSLPQEQNKQVDEVSCPLASTKSRPTAIHPSGHQPYNPMRCN